MAEKSLKKNAFYSFIKAFMTLAFPIITFPYASRILLPEGIGKVNFVNSIVSYFTILAGLGIGVYATREASRLRNDKVALSKFCKEILIINFISTTVAYILFIIAIVFIPKLYEYRTLIIVASSNILFTTLGIDWLYKSLEEFRYITIRSVLFQIISLVFLFTFVRTPQDTLTYLIFGLISSVGSNIFNFIYSRKYIDYKIKVHLEFLKHIKHIFIFFGMNLVTSIYTILDTSMLGFLTNPTEVGYYTAATKINRMVMTLIASVISILLPRLTFYVEKKDEKSFLDLTQKSMNTIFLLALPCMCGLILLAKPLILLFSGNEYLPAVTTMQLMTPLILIISLGSFTGVQLLTSIGAEKSSLISYICGAIVNIICNFILIPIYKSLGAGIASVLAELTVVTIQIIFCVKKINLKSIKKSIFVNLSQAVVSSIVMVLFVILIQRFITNAIIQIMLSVIFGALIYSIMLFIFHNALIKEILLKVFNKLKKNKSQS